MFPIIKKFCHSQKWLGRTFLSYRIKLTCTRAQKENGCCATVLGAEQKMRWQEKLGVEVYETHFCYHIGNFVKISYMIKALRAGCTRAQKENGCCATVLGAEQKMRWQEKLGVEVCETHFCSVTLFLLFLSCCRRHKFWYFRIFYKAGFGNNTFFYFLAWKLFLSLSWRLKP